MKFSDEQINRIKEVYQDIENQTEVAKILSKEFGLKVTRQNVGYYLKQDDVPMSEREEKLKEATSDECIKVIRQMAEKNPDKIITRNFFRVNSPLAESAWNKHFGTFEEFKKQAGIKLTRHARKMEMDIAKHASIENYRAMTDQKRGWEGAYLKPSGNRFKTILIGSDVHDIECDPFWRYLFIETAKRVNPDIIVFGGDLFDLCEFGKYDVDPREWDVIGRIKWVHTFLGDVREVCPDTEIHLLEGNHCYRLLRHLSEATPAMKAILSDLHGFTVSKLLGLDNFEVNYVAPADLATFTQSDMKAQLRRNFLIIDDMLVVHHFPEGESFGLPGVNGHHHKHLVDTNYSPLIGPYEWHQLGSGHKREANYCNGEKWSNGFMLVHTDTQNKTTQFEYIDTSYSHCVIGGKWYERKD